MEKTLLAVSPCSVGPNVDRSLKSWVDLKGNLGEKFDFLRILNGDGKWRLGCQFRVKSVEVFWLKTSGVDQFV
jgi:hypothetical protein